MGHLACLRRAGDLRERRCPDHRRGDRRILRSPSPGARRGRVLPPVEHRQRHRSRALRRPPSGHQGPSAGPRGRAARRDCADSVLSRRETAFAAEVVAGPLPLGLGHAIVESYVDVGAPADAHRPEIRRALARGLRAIVTTCEPLVATTRLGPALLASPLSALWPRPHSRLFDFEATAAGAEWIDEIARLARERMAPAGVEVIGHGDWRQEHVRFVADEPVAAFDWDSLCRQYEPALLGCVAHGFCADWSRNDRRQAPTLAEARAFVGDYETARGSAFSASERQLCAAAFAYACAYTARCGHALGKDERGEAGTFAHLVWTEREKLLLM